MHADKRRGRTHSRILYWFRTPPGVRVGRAPLDEDAIRLIEESNPGIEFDWPRILKGPEITPPRPQAPPERRARPRLRDVPQRESPAPAPPSAPPAPSAEVPGESPPTAVPTVQRPEPLVAVSTLAEDPGPPWETPAVAASARLGVEGLARLRARHAEVLARISEKISDPARREELKADAARLNPDTWVTDADVAVGLESYESVFETLRGVIGHRRKRRRGRSSGEGAGGQLPAPDGAEPPDVDRGGPADPPEDP